MKKFSEFLKEEIITEEEAWHGSPHRFDSFSRKQTAHTGEGGAAYGSGIYVSSHKAVGKYYRDNTHQTGNNTLYKLKLATDKNKMLHWHKKISDHSEHVQKVVKKVAHDFPWHENPNPEGRHIFHHIRKSYSDMGYSRVESSEATSNNLHKGGLHGIEYHGDVDNKSKERPTNKVIFDPKKIKIQSKYKSGEDE